MKRYESYKDSGVKWLGEIPGHWEVKRLGSFFIERRVKVSDKDFAPLSVTKNGIFPQLENVAKSNDGDNRKLVRANDFVINSRSDRKGSSGVSSFDGSVSLINIVLKPRNTVYPTFCNYLLKSIAFIEEYYRNGRGIVADLWTTRFDEMKIIKLAMPPKAEQTAIANYLDSVTSKIDEAISQQQKMIDLLNERKQIIIQNAVTKGLDPNAKMKDSGVEWIGEIPEDWEVRPIKTLLKLKKKLVGSKSNQYNLLSLSIDGIKIRDLNNPMGKFPTSFDTYQEVNKNDFVFCNFDNEETPRAVGLSKVHGMITGAYDVMALYDLRVDIEYLYLVFLDIDNFKKFKPLYKGLRKTVPYDSFMSYKIAIPPFEEQREISESLLVFLKNIDSSISQCNKMISLLQERKQIIINDVVTGKVKVI